MGNAESCECSVPSEGGVSRFINDPWKGLGLVYYPEADDSDNDDDDIDEVLEGKLYLGGMAGAMNHKALRQRGITHVLCMANYEQAPKAFRPSHYTYLVLHAVDAPSYNIRRHFPISNRFISDALAQNGKVYVHCVAGVSRAPAAAAAYLMAATTHGGAAQAAAVPPHRAAQPGLPAATAGIRAGAAARSPPRAHPGPLP
eukprot:CAMPEP_0172205472 /NCGR_PEP_ID=MMETSP1050-20130122/32635_1 /TAXON_ID=233186 /ORGANISM="Cryptomonas curvata, Strain CCAP979/52" /LENGTH=199 /DNA_ID=CAMNT_0012884355 /DNA_START=65 /DNA_END=661 /DNA_ORIENTATION=+